MKQTTNDWLIAAEDDLLAALKLRETERLTKLVAVHCRQCIEKCFIAVIEEQGKPSPKSHDLIRLQKQANIELDTTEAGLLSLINAICTAPHHPEEHGLVTQRRPTVDEADRFIQFSEKLYYRVVEELSTPDDKMVD